MSLVKNSSTFIPNEPSLQNSLRSLRVSAYSSSNIIKPESFSMIPLSSFPNSKRDLLSNVSFPEYNQAPNENATYTTDDLNIIQVWFLFFYLEYFQDY